MQHPNHELLAARPQMSRERLMGYLLAGAVNVGLVFMLIDGLAMHYVVHAPAELKATVIAPTKPENTQPIPKPTMIVPKDTVTPPEIVVQQQPQPTIATKTAPASPSAAPTRANGISSTHTTPPYPADAKKAGQHGTVQLHIMISAQGDVTSATVTRSSGVPLLDQTAAAWVTAHWKYKPATDNGTAVASTSDAQVVFDLKNAS